MPYDVTAWSLGMQFGVRVDFISTMMPSVKLTRVSTVTRPAGRVSGNGPLFAFSNLGPDTAIAINRLLKDGARLSLESPSIVVAENARRDKMESLARELGLTVVSTEAPPPTAQAPRPRIRLPRIAVYAPWTSGNIDEGWTRWVLEQYEFPVTTIHNGDFRDGNLLGRKFDVIILPDQSPRELVEGFTASSVRPEFRGGIGESGVDTLARFVNEGGTLVTLGTASDLIIDRFPIPVRNLKRG